MDTNKIESFLVLSKYLNFTQAAEEQYISQPTMTAHINALERELGFQLFYRNKKSVSLTPAGKVLADGFSYLQNWYKQTVVRAKAVSQDSLELKIGYQGPVNWASVTDSARVFRLLYQDIGLSLHMDGWLKLIQKVSHKVLDAIIAEVREVEDIKNLTYVSLFRIPVCVYLPIEHPLAMYKKLNLQEFSNERFIVMQEQYAPRATSRSMYVLKDQGAKIEDCLRPASYQEAVSLISAGLGVALFPAHYIKSEYITCVELENEEFYDETVLAWNSTNDNPFIPLFCKILQEHT